MARTLVVSNCAVERAIHAQASGLASAAPPSPVPAPRSSSLSSFQFPSLVVLKTPVAAAAYVGNLEEGSGLGPARRGGASATPLFPKHLALRPETWPCVRRFSSLLGLGAFRKSREGFAPPSRAARGRVVGGTAPLSRRAWEVARGWRAFRDYFLLQEAAGHWARRGSTAVQGARR